jgi:hypothetical protein
MRSLSQTVTRHVVGVYDENSLSVRARNRRWRVFMETFPDIAEMSVLDLGGDARAWQTAPAPVRPARLLLWNLFPQEVDESWIESEIADACNPPHEIPEVDLIYSNSVIGHVGGHWRRQRFVDTVHTASRYWVQTPNRYFPIEPSFMFPWLQHLPRKLQQELIARWPVGNFATVVDRREVLNALLEIELLSRTELRFYFPDAVIHSEKVLGMTKSFVAIRR